MKNRFGKLDIDSLDCFDMLYGEINFVTAAKLYQEHQGENKR